MFCAVDGLVDCVDPDCCVSASCRDSMDCQTVPEPMEILLRKQPPSSSASFYERVRFLIEDDSVQSYATLSSFNQRSQSCCHLTTVNRLLTMTVVQYRAGLTIRLARLNKALGPQNAKVTFLIGISVAVQLRYIYFVLFFL